MEYYQILILVLILVASYSLGYFAKQYLVKKNLGDLKGFGTIEGSLLALFAFFLGFTFNISSNKIGEVRKTSVDEANTVGTALLRTEMYSEEEQKQYNILFKKYLKERIDYFDKPSNSEDSKNEFNRSNKKAEEIWNYTLQLAENKDNTEKSRLMIPAVNDMIDAVTSRDSAINAKLPKSIINTLYILCICSCFIIGFSMEKVIYTNFIGIIYIIIIALTVNLIIDAGNPRTGFINTSKSNDFIVEIYHSIP